MTDLRHIQQAFQRYLTDDDEAISGFIVSSATAKAEHRLATYFNAYRVRLINGLGINYPLVKAMLGEARFEGLAIDYLHRHPSNHSSVRWFGDQFSEFLAAESGPENFELLSELAVFEWSRLAVFDEQHADNLISLQDMAQLPAAEWPQLRFTFKPAIQIVEFNYDVPRLVAAIEANEPKPELLKQPHARQWLVWRQQLDMHWRSLAADETWALQEAMQGKEFSAICDGLTEWNETDQIALRAAALVKQWIHDQLITNLQ